MRLRTKISGSHAGAIRRAMLAAPNRSTFQRLQCLWLRVRRDLSAEAIAQTVGLSTSHVRRIWSDYLRNGLAGGQGRPKGGRRHAYWTVEQERALLAPIRRAAERGKPVTVQNIQRRFENKLGRAVTPSTVYRLLARHQWRRLGNHHQESTSLKTPHRRNGRSRWAPPGSLCACCLSNKCTSLSG